MFVEFLYALRKRKVPVGAQEAVALARALAGGLHDSSLEGFYFTARALLVHSEAHLDDFDVAFGQLSMRNHARYSPPVGLADSGQPAEWEILLRLSEIAQGRGPGGVVDVAALDERLARQEAERFAGDRAEQAFAEASRWRGPERRLDLALRAGPHGDDFGRRPGGVRLAALLDAPSGIDLGALAPRLPEVLRTPSGRVDLAPPMLLGDLPRALAALNEPAPPLVIIGRRDVRSNNSWMHNLPTLAKGPFRGAMQVHPVDAQRLGLAEGASALVRRSDDADRHDRHITVQIHVDDSVMPGVVCLPHGWGHDQPDTRLQVAGERPGANLNAVLDERLRDPLSGNAVLSGVAVVVDVVETPGPARYSSVLIRHSSGNSTTSSILRR